MYTRTTFQQIYKKSKRFHGLVNQGRGTARTCLETVAANTYPFFERKRRLPRCRLWAILGDLQHKYKAASSSDLYTDVILYNSGLFLSFPYSGAATLQPVPDNLQPKYIFFSLLWNHLQSQTLNLDASWLCYSGYSFSTFHGKWIKNWRFTYVMKQCHASKLTHGTVIVTRDLWSAF